MDDTTDSEGMEYENEAEREESEARKKLRAAKAPGVRQDTPAKEQGVKRTERYELDPVTGTKPKSLRTNAQPKPTPMAYKYSESFPDRGFKPVGDGVALEPDQSVLSITWTTHGEAPKVRHIGRKRDSSYTCAHAGENGMPLVGNACQSLRHAAIRGDVCPHVSHLRDGQDGTFYKNG